MAGVTLVDPLSQGRPAAGKEMEAEEEPAEGRDWAVLGVPSSGDCLDVQQGLWATGGWDENYGHPMDWGREARNETRGKPQGREI